MDIKDAIEAKHQLDTDLANLIQGRISEFTRQTGLAARGVTVDMIHAKFIEELSPRSFVTKVTTDVTIQ